MTNIDQFQKELTELINKHSLENGCDTPDFVLAGYLVECLKTFNKTVQARVWFGGKVDLTEVKP